MLSKAYFGLPFMTVHFWCSLLPTDPLESIPWNKRLMYLWPEAPALLCGCIFFGFNCTELFLWNSLSWHESCFFLCVLQKCSAMIWLIRSVCFVWPNRSPMRGSGLKSEKYRTCVAHFLVGCVFSQSYEHHKNGGLLQVGVPNYFSRVSYTWPY